MYWTWLRFPSHRTPFVAVAAAAGVIWLIIATWSFHNSIGHRPVPWVGWADQTRYLQSALAWWRWDLDPAQHNYPPGYALAAAPFTQLFPRFPFAVPDLLFLLVSFVLFNRLCGRLLPSGSAWQVAGRAAFCVATVGTHTLRSLWFVPWTSTEAAPLQFGCLLAALWAGERARSAPTAVLGLVIGVLTGVRPVDAVVIAIPCVAYVLGTAGVRAAFRASPGFLAGIVAGAFPFAVLHLASHHWSLGGYLQGSARIGFEWRLLPLRWVLIAIDSRPLTAEGPGIVEGVVWVLPGLAGLLWACWRGPRPWRLLAAAVALHWAIYLCYRDLEPGGLWRFNNVHYFKWTFPILLLAACRFAAALVERRERASALICGAAVLPVFMLQARFVPTGRTEAVLRSPSALALPDQPASVYSAWILPLQGSWQDIYTGRATLDDGAGTFRNVDGFKLFPRPGGALLEPLRPLGGTGLLFHPDPRTLLDDTRPVVTGYVQISPGLPCGLWYRRSCVASQE